MNIFEIAEKFNLSIAKVKRMEKAGLLVATGNEGHPLAPTMRQTLINRRPLSAEQLLVLVQEPTVIAELRQRQGDARAQIAALGDFKADKPEPSFFPVIVDAAGFDDAAQRKLIAWLQGILPGEPVAHAWIAVRVAQGVRAGSGRDELLNTLTKALANCRKHEAFKGWYGSTSLAGKSRAFYFNPNKKEFDL
jgi:hypothetical protein